MKFLYEYKTKENERRSGEIDAPSRPAVYAELKKQGIRPYKVDLAPGFWNWVRSLGKRTAAIVVLAILCVTLAIAVGRIVLNAPQPSPVEESLDSPIRRQVIGDTAIIEKGIRTGWADVFELEGERFLASFAIPGVPAGQRSTTEEEIRKALSTRHEARGTQSDSLEARQIVAMVEGMKDELRDFLRAGGTIREFGACLVERQEAELGYYNRTKGELETLSKSGMPDKELETLWEKRNSELRQMGIRLVPLPE